MKICIIGNSHVGAIKRAWECFFDEKSKKSITITFFAARQNLLQHLDYNRGRLRPTKKVVEECLSFTSGGKRFIDLAAYDTFLLYGLGTRPYFINDLFYSEALIEKSLSEYYSKSLAVKILKMIPADSAKQIYIGHNPMVAEKQKPQRNAYKPAIEDYTRGISLANQNYFRPLGSELLMQPSQTIAESGQHTKSVFSRGSQRLEVGDSIDHQLHPENERSHMNDEFGKVWLDQFLSDVKKEH